MTTTEAILELYNNRDEYISKVAYRVGGKDNAEDVVQEAFTRALKYNNTYDDSKPITKWFNGILNNATRDFKRDEKAGGMVSSSSETDELDSEMFKEEMASIILDEMGNYKDMHLNVLRMFLLYGYTAKEIREVVGTSVINIRKIVYRFKDTMVQKYGEDMCS